MILQNLLLGAVGIVGLYFGGSFLIDGASRLARGIGIAPAVVGLTIVAFGTSMPEMVTVVVAALRGTPEVAVGNIVGSNIANIGLILGLVGVVAVAPITLRPFRGDWMIMVAVTALAIFLLMDGQLSRLDGIVLAIGLPIYAIRAIRQPRAETDDKTEDTRSLRWNVLLIVGGLLLLVVGAQATVDGAVALAEAIGISEFVIGLTLVAVGTSLPELMTSIVAARKGEDDLLLGNIIGSNIFNLLAILGVAGMISPFTVNPSAQQLDIPVMAAFALLPGLLMLGRGKLNARGGVLLIGAYGAYLAVLLFTQAA